MSNVKKNDVGTTITLNVGVDITGASNLSIEVLKPSAATQSWASTIGADNKSVTHIMAAGDLDEAGDYLLQAKLTLGVGTWRGDTVGLMVKDLFK